MTIPSICFRIMATRKISNDPNKPLTLKLGLNYIEKQKVKIKCIKHNVTLTEVVENSLREWIKDVPDKDVTP